MYGKGQIMKRKIRKILVSQTAQTEIINRKGQVIGVGLLRRPKIVVTKP